jgi:hypothetical protein
MIFYVPPVCGWAAVVTAEVSFEALGVKDVGDCCEQLLRNRKPATNVNVNNKYKFFIIAPP